MPWVSHAKHLGNFLSEDGTTDHDMKVKKGIFIQSAMEINQEFFCLPAPIKMRLNLLFNSHFSGSNIWKFESDEASHLFSSWSKNIKLVYDLPWATHRWVLEAVSSANLKTMLLSRFIKFVNAIMKTAKPALKFLLSVVSADVRSLTGSNLRSILRTTGVQVRPGVTHPGAVKKVTLHKVPEGQEWKVPLLHSLIAVRAGEFNIEFDDNEEDTPEIADAIMVDLCIN